MLSYLYFYLIFLSFIQLKGFHNKTYQKKNKMNIEVADLAESGNKRKGDFDKLIQDFDQTCKKVLQNNLVPNGFFVIPSTEANLSNKTLYNEEKGKRNKMNSLKNLEEKNDEKKEWMNFLWNNDQNMKKPETDVMKLLEDNNDIENDLLNILAEKNSRFSQR